MNTFPDIQLVLEPGVVSEPLFPTPEDYQRFRDEYIREMAPILKEQEILRRKSEEAARLKWVS